MPIDKKKYKQEFKRQKAKGKKFGEADKVAMKYAALPYKNKSKVKKDISPQARLRAKILKSQERYKPKSKPKAVVKPKKKSLLEKTRERVKKLFSKKKQKPHITARTKSVEKNLSRSLSQKEIAKLRGKKK